MRVIGLTGGVGSGKSLAAKLLCDITGGELLIADHLGHVEMKKNTVGYHRIVEAFGRGILSRTGGIDRERLAQQVFGDPEELRRLNDIVHPLVKEYLEEYIGDRQREQGLIILESAILFETGCDRFCDYVWYVWMPQQMRIQRLKKTRGYTGEKCKAIIAQQMQEEEYRSKSMYTVRNDGSVEELKKKLEELWSCTQRKF